MFQRFHCSRILVFRFVLLLAVLNAMAGLLLVVQSFSGIFWGLFFRTWKWYFKSIAPFSICFRTTNFCFYLKDPFESEKKISLCFTEIYHFARDFCASFGWHIFVLHSIGIFYFKFNNENIRTIFSKLTIKTPSDECLYF